MRLVFFAALIAAANAVRIHDGQDIDDDIESLSALHNASRLASHITDTYRDESSGLPGDLPDLAESNSRVHLDSVMPSGVLKSLPNAELRAQFQEDLAEAKHEDLHDRLFAQDLTSERMVKSKALKKLEKNNAKQQHALNKEIKKNDKIRQKEAEAAQDKALAKAEKEKDAYKMKKKL